MASESKRMNIALVFEGWVETDPRESGLPPLQTVMQNFGAVLGHAEGTGGVTDWELPLYPEKLVEGGNAYRLDCYALVFDGQVRRVFESRHEADAYAAGYGKGTVVHLSGMLEACDDE